MRKSLVTLMVLASLLLTSVPSAQAHLADDLSISAFKEEDYDCSGRRCKRLVRWRVYVTNAGSKKYVECRVVILDEDGDRHASEMLDFGNIARRSTKVLPTWWYPFKRAKKVALGHCHTSPPE